MPASRKVAATVTLNLQAGAADPAKVAKDLGPHGVNLARFRAAYDAATAAHRGLVVPARVTVFEDRSFELTLRTPTTATLLLRAAGLERGGARPGGEPAGWIGRDQLREVARAKLPDLNTADLDAAERIVAGTARSIGIGVKD
jgi:large subunit ribosomal protein L11